MALSNQHKAVIYNSPLSSQIGLPVACVNLEKGLDAIIDKSYRSVPDVLPMYFWSAVSYFATLLVLVLSLLLLVLSPLSLVLLLDYSLNFVVYFLGFFEAVLGDSKSLPSR
jgi:uncharacterized BrkB/YihY/UPF0761 family membrane protein